MDHPGDAPGIAVKNTLRMVAIHLRTIEEDLANVDLGSLAADREGPPALLKRCRAYVAHLQADANARYPDGAEPVSSAVEYRDYITDKLIHRTTALGAYVPVEGKIVQFDGGGEDEDGGGGLYSVYAVTVYPQRAVGSVVVVRLAQRR